LKFFVLLLHTTFNWCFLSLYIFKKKVFFHIGFSVWINILVRS
jgi:hypothetical protein